MRKYSFVAIDIEKANNEATSICSIGLAFFKDGTIVKQKEYTIRPEPYYYYKGIYVANKTTYHGIPFEIYEKSCTFDKIWPKIEKMIKGEILVGHGISGDILLITNTLNHYGIKCDWLSEAQTICTNIASIYVYPDLTSHKLGAICECINVKIKPHHALSDAKASGYVLLDMMNITDAPTVQDFIKICNTYNDIITTNFTENNLQKYEDQILQMFNYNKREIRAVNNRNKQFVENILQFFKSKQPESYSLPKIKIKPCISPIIEIYKNKNYVTYIDRLNACRPFVNDGVLFIKKKSRDYTLFIGALTDKRDIMTNVLMMLARDSVKASKNNFYSQIMRNYKKNYIAATLAAQYMTNVDNIDEYEVYEYIESLYMQEVLESKNLSYINNIEKTILDTKSTNKYFDNYLKIIKERTRIIALYNAMKDLYPIFADGLELEGSPFEGPNTILHVLAKAHKDNPTPQKIRRAVESGFQKDHLMLIEKF